MARQDKNETYGKRASNERFEAALKGCSANPAKAHERDPAG